MPEDQARFNELSDMSAELKVQVFRMRVALQLARAFTMSGYAASVQMLLIDWIDSGCVSPVPWPECPFAQEFLQDHGYCECQGTVVAAAKQGKVDESQA